MNDNVQESAKSLSVWRAVIDSLSGEFRHAPIGTLGAYLAITLAGYEFASSLFSISEPKPPALVDHANGGQLFGVVLWACLVQIVIAFSWIKIAAWSRYSLSSNFISGLILSLVVAWLSSSNGYWTVDFFIRHKEGKPDSLITFFLFAYLIMLVFTIVFGREAKNMDFFTGISIAITGIISFYVFGYLFMPHYINLLNERYAQSICCGGF